MSQILLNATAVPGVPAAGKMSIFYDTADKRLKIRGEDGTTIVLQEYSQIDNVLANGGFMFAQRQAPATLTTYSPLLTRSYGADRWGQSAENASIQYQRVDTMGAVESGIAARYYGKYKKITSAGKIAISQAIEANNAAMLRGRAVRFQVKMRFTVAASMVVRLGLLQLTSAGVIDTIPGFNPGSGPSGSFVTAFNGNGTDPTLGTNLSFIAPRLAESSSAGAVVISGNAVTCTLTGGWLRFSGVFDVPTTCKNVIPVIFSNSQLAANDELNITEAGLYDGEEVMDWGRDVWQLELLKCQRYYAKTFAIDTAPAQNAGTTTGELRLPSPVGASAAFANAWTWEFPAVMHSLVVAASPILTLFNPAAANAQIRNETLSTDCTLSGVITAGERRMYITGTTPASTVAGTNILGVHVTADAEF